MIKIDAITPKGHPAFRDHSVVYYFSDEGSGLRGYIALHSFFVNRSMDLLVSGGGTRWWPYQNDNNALTDVLRLSYGMAQKAALADIASGGGKAVIIARPGEIITSKQCRAYANVLNALNDALQRNMDAVFLTGEDLGIRMEDVDVIREETKWVFGTSKELWRGSGDPSPMTALGVRDGIRVCLEEAYGSDELSGRVVAIQGVGKVGRELLGFLLEEGALPVVADTNEAPLRAVKKELGSKVIIVPSDEIHKQRANVFAPCARGGVLNRETIPELNCKIVAGSANNQLAEREDGRALHERGILYAPDMIINAGGLINVAAEQLPNGYDRAVALGNISRIADRLREVFETSRTAASKPPSIVAEDIGRQKIKERIKESAEFLIEKGYRECS